MLGSSLMIMRGAKIQAVGTADAPIVFTSSRRRRPAPARRLGRPDHRRQRADNRSGSVAVEGTGTDGNTVVERQELHGASTTAAPRPRTTPARSPTCAWSSPASHRSQDQEFNSFTFAAVGSGTKRVVPRVARRPRRLVRVLRRRLRPRPPRRLRDGRRHVRHVGGLLGAHPVRGRAGHNVQLVPRTGAGFYADGPRGHRERRLQRHGLRPRLQLRAVHHPDGRQLHAHRLRRRHPAWARAAVMA